MKEIHSSDFFNETYLREYFRRKILRKKGGGRDNLTPERFLEKFGSDFNTISQKCLDGNYHFSYYKEKLIVKSSKKRPRVLSIPTVRDRLVLGVLNDYLSTVFSDCVNHEIPNRLIYQVDHYINSQSQNKITFLRTDFSDFYGSLQIKLLMNMISSRVEDHAIKTLIYKAITTPTIAENSPKKNIRAAKQGIPQGLSISNILASIYMLSFDKEFGQAQAGLYIRYVDDILFLDVKCPSLMHRMLTEIKKRNLHLRLSIEKCKSGTIGSDTLDFIGYEISKKIFVRKKNVTRFLNRVAALVSKCKEGLDHTYRRPMFIKEIDSYKGYYVEELNLLISGFKYSNRLYGWLPYFQAINDVSSLYGMDYVIQHHLLKDLPDEITSKVKSLVDTYYDIRRHGGSNLVEDYDSLTSVDQRKSFLKRKGRIDMDKSYTDEQINNYFESYMDYISNVSEQNIGFIS